MSACTTGGNPIIDPPGASRYRYPDDVAVVVVVAEVVALPLSFPRSSSASSTFDGGGGGSSSMRVTHRLIFGVFSQGVFARRYAYASSASDGGRKFGS